MPEYYTKATRLQSGFTYAVGGGNTGFTAPSFPSGACAMDAFNAFMLIPRDLIASQTPLAPGMDVSAIFANSNKGFTFMMYPNTIYPYRLKVLGFTGNFDIMGLG